MLLFSCIKISKEMIEEKSVQEW